MSTKVILTGMINTIKADNHNNIFCEFTIKNKAIIPLMFKFNTKETQSRMSALLLEKTPLLVFGELENFDDTIFVVADKYIFLETLKEKFSKVFMSDEDMERLSEKGVIEEMADSYENNWNH